jgi:hypothetical protein
MIFFVFTPYMLNFPNQNSNVESKTLNYINYSKSSVINKIRVYWFWIFSREDEILHSPSLF